jgi:hypothetical protein
VPQDNIYIYDVKNFWLYRELHICGVSKMFGEWYQKTIKTEDTNKLTVFVSSVLFVFWYHSPNFLDTLHICNISWLRVKFGEFLD